MSLAHISLLLSPFLYSPPFSCEGTANCKVDAYSPTCQTCAEGQYADQTGQVACKPCGKGTYSGIQGATAECLDPAYGWYKGSLGQSCNDVCSASRGSCRVERAHAVTNSARFSFVNDLMSGLGRDSFVCGSFDTSNSEYYPGQYLATCKTYLSNPAASTCVKAHPDISRMCCCTVSSADAATLCPIDGVIRATCGDKDRAGVATDASQCSKCSAGKSSAKTGAFSASVCTNCTAGKYAAEEGSSECTPCSAGYYSKGKGAVACVTVPCKEGATWSASGNAPCKVCSVAGSCGAGVNATCSPGSDIVCNGAVAPCVGGTSFSGSGKAPCTPCTAESTCAAAGVKQSCNTTTDAVCEVPCAEGSTWSTTGNAPCEACAVDAICSSGVKTACTTTIDTVCEVPCESGATWSVSGNAPCKVCAADSTCEGAGNVKTACTTTTDTVCKAPCMVGATWSALGYAPCASCSTDATCGAAGVKTACSPRSDIVCNEAVVAPPPAPLPAPAVSPVNITVSILKGAYQSFTETAATSTVAATTSVVGMSLVATAVAEVMAVTSVATSSTAAVTSGGAGVATAAVAGGGGASVGGGAAAAAASSVGVATEVLIEHVQMLAITKHMPSLDPCGLYAQR
jgi:hypothetical protein